MKYVMSLDLDPKTFEETYAEPWSCPIAKHFQAQGYNVEVSPYQIVFLPLYAESLLEPEDVIIVECEASYQQMLPFAKRGTPFVRELDLPDILTTPNSPYRKEQ